MSALSNSRYKTETDIPIEDVTGGVPNIPTDHKMIHDGYGMCMSLYLAALAPEAKKVWRLKGPTTLFAHIKSLQVHSMGSTIMARLVYDPTITTAGTEVIGAIQNLNQNSSTVAQSKVYDSAVAYTGGTIWCRAIVHGSTTRQSEGSGSFKQSQDLEYITKSGDTDYIIELENLDTSDTASFILVDMFFYEESKGLT